MAIRSIGKIVLYEPLDNDKITELLVGSDTIIFEIERPFLLEGVPSILSATLPTQFDDVSINYIDSLKEIVDISLWQHLENVLVFKVNYNEVSKEFDLTNSYVRDSKDTSGALTAITTGKVLKAKFITPGLDAPVITIVDLPYGQAISSGDTAALLAVGLDLETVVAGDLFSFKDQKVPYKVEFYKPESEVLNYIIDFNYKNKTIEI
ncbi:MAG: hypothetical protein CMP76_17275 [Flavobacterium sp.]|uniref:hypothetical protein n=1 Tax=Flavobacterium sp. TaxID=239 RepID=UPI000C6A81D2|nr:hypothetical protein [Flavobacterium sp.]MBF05031.1 hypothetical protein [Flavobacterium sp.]|tara:strand:+ start:431 stop:1051 length:621 start_codon:yes stop_codon:yes gene_type:complete